MDFGISQFKKMSGLEISSKLKFTKKQLSEST